MGNGRFSDHFVGYFIIRNKRKEKGEDSTVRLSLPYLKNPFQMTSKPSTTMSCALEHTETTHSRRKFRSSNLNLTFINQFLSHFPPNYVENWEEYTLVFFLKLMVQ